MVFKISMIPENHLTQLITAPDLSRAREIAGEIEERYEVVEEFDGRDVRLFMPVEYVDGFVDRYLENDEIVGVSLWRESKEEWRGFACFEAYKVLPSVLEIIMGILPADHVVIPIKEEAS